MLGSWQPLLRSVASVVEVKCRSFTESSGVRRPVCAAGWCSLCSWLLVCLSSKGAAALDARCSLAGLAGDVSRLPGSEVHVPTFGMSSEVCGYLYCGCLQPQRCSFVCMYSHLCPLAICILVSSLHLDLQPPYLGMRLVHDVMVHYVSVSVACMCSYSL